MRIILFAIFYVISLNGIYAQCEVDAGASQNFCPSDTKNLNGSIISGKVDRTAWEFSYYLAPLDRTYYASDLLSDSTILSPNILNILDNNTMRFYLLGYASNGSTCIDSVDHNFSHFTIGLQGLRTSKERTDTFQLYHQVFASWGIEKFEWSPNYMISDTSAELPFVWNDTTTFYSLEVTDSIGCKASDRFEVYVNSTSIDNNYQSTQIKLFPNPAREEINIVSDERIIETYLYNMNGQLFQISNNDKIDISSFPKGEYIAISKMEDGKLVGRSFIKL